MLWHEAERRPDQRSFENEAYRIFRSRPCAGGGCWLGGVCRAFQRTVSRRAGRLEPGRSGNAFDRGGRGGRNPLTTLVLEWRVGGLSIQGQPSIDNWRDGRCYVRARRNTGPRIGSKRGTGPGE